jgi:hypothetical protein
MPVDAPVISAVPLSEAISSPLAGIMPALGSTFAELIIGCVAYNSADVLPQLFFCGAGGCAA